MALLTSTNLNSSAKSSRLGLGPTKITEDERVLKKAENSSAKNIYSQQLDFQRGASRTSTGVYIRVNEDASETCNKAENSSAKSITSKGFTLIEVLIALAIVSIGLGALIKATATSTKLAQILTDKTISHLIAFEGVEMIQLGLLKPPAGIITTEKTKLMHKYWYWRPEIKSTPIQDLDLIQIKVSTKSVGPYKNALYAFWYHPND